MSYGGVLDDTRASAAVSILVQQPNRVRIDISGPNRRTAAFDGATAQFPATPLKLDEDLLESLTVDTPEGFLDAIRRGAAFRLLGVGFRPSAKEYPSYSGPSWDIFELYTNTAVRRSQQAPIRRFYFDTATGLLASTRYPVPGSTAASPPLIETRFSGWRTVNGSPLPSRVERVEAGTQTFALDLPTAVLEGKRDDGVFRMAGVI